MKKPELAETKIVLPNAVMLGGVKAFLQGVSMSPFIRGERDSVELEWTPSLSVGDIALAEIAPDVYVLHRIVALDGDRVTLQGDGNLRGQEHCRAEHVCGVVRAILRPGGRRIDCRTAYFQWRSRCWRCTPRRVRRVCLALYRRINFL